MDKALKRLEQLKRELEAAKVAAERTTALLRSSEEVTGHVTEELHGSKKPPRRAARKKKAV